ncbi:hypothetical protein GCK32_007224 [Trichostrongylus colubriformis]|uniref:SCP domain-containing protein n=1 Tax=Trichostrongylus colubriformis TaxID=6319 RepID=A0AAN8F4N7_TRICO
MILLPMVFLLIHGAFGQNRHLYVKSLLDEFRQAVANGTFSKPGGGRLPSSSAMFVLTEDTQLNFVALANVYNCIKPSNPYLAEGSSMNFFSVTNMNAPYEEKRLVDNAFNRWKREPFAHGIRDDVIYDNTNIQNFANMIYYQATKYGCAVKTCYGPPVTHAFACVFDKHRYRRKACGNVNTKNTQSDIMHWPHQGSGTILGVRRTSQDLIPMIFCRGPQLKAKSVKSVIMESHKVAVGKICRGLCGKTCVSCTVE